MRFFIAALALLSASPALAQEPGLQVGQTIRDLNGLRLGQIDRISKDGSVRLIFDGRFVTVPADSVEVVDGKPRTKLTKKDVGKL